MRVLILLVLLAVGFDCFALSVGEYVGTGACVKAKVTRDIDNVFLVSEAADSRVEVLIALSEKYFDEVIFSQFNTPVVASLRRNGLQIVHVPSGLVCAHFGKAGVIGSPIWLDEQHCRFSSKDRVKAGACVRDYFMFVK